MCRTERSPARVAGHNKTRSRGDTLFGEIAKPTRIPRIIRSSGAYSDHGNSERTIRGYSSALPWSRESQTDTCRGACYSDSPQPPPRKQPGQAQGFAGRRLVLPAFDAQSNVQNSANQRQCNSAMPRAYRRADLPTARLKGRSTTEVWGHCVLCQESREKWRQTGA